MKSTVPLWSSGVVFIILYGTQNEHHWVQVKLNLIVRIRKMSNERMELDLKIVLIYTEMYS